MDKKVNNGLTRKERKDLRVLALFTSVYCRDHHRDRESFRLNPVATGLAGVQKYHYCAECRDFLLYALERRLRCPLEPKPMCKHCQVHCFRPGHREKVREVMRYSGKTLILRGRLDLLWHYLF
ncbi:MAG: nitrous oxide-stimulated promoter family protein [Desulfuromonadales bacterium]|nr:nitrous oxide-stimulated promoter family protein [Desulfuromonadales bacterium]